MIERGVCASPKAVLNFKKSVGLLIQLSRQCRNYSKLQFLSPLTKYDQEVAQGKLVDDEHQRQVIKKLERVYEEVQNYQPGKRNVFSRFFSIRRTTNAPRGIYLYGAVGGGKTMLMDLFYDCCKVCTIFMFR